jgi:hypothetical protein
VYLGKVFAESEVSIEDYISNVLSDDQNEHGEPTAEW